MPQVGAVNEERKAGGLTSPGHAPITLSIGRIVVDKIVAVANAL
jgi:hypothetical protein